MAKTKREHAKSADVQKKPMRPSSSVPPRRGSTGSRPSMGERQTALVASDAAFAAMPLPELLAPVGSPEALKAAVSAGADAVYLGGTLHNARMNAKNFTEEDLAEAIAFCHRRGVRVYITMNTLLWDRELPEALSYAARLYEMGADALIVADLGFAALLRRWLPDLPLHASTQMSAHNSPMAKLLSELGFTRMVCAREMPRADVEALVKASPIEIEQFVHGALCVSASGQCLASAMIGGRSGNRGCCAQPCRMRYNGGYPLSLKDLSLAAHVPALIRSGVHSLKIEGRMKSPEYVFGTVAVWRRLLDERRGATSAELAHLAKLFSRSGLTDGYYTAHHADMCGIRTEEDKAATRRISAVDATHQAAGRRPPISVQRQRILLPEDAVEQTFAALWTEASKRQPSQEIGCSAGFSRREQIPAVHPFLHVDLPLDSYSEEADGVRLPAVIFERELSRFENALGGVTYRGAVRARITNLGQLPAVLQKKLIPVGDFRLNVANKLTAAVLMGLGIGEIMASPELTLPRLRDFATPKTVFVYGKLPLMLLERDPGVRQLRDRTGAVFSVRAEGGRYVLHNAVPHYMFDRKNVLREANITHGYCLFTTETREDVCRVIEAMETGAPPQGDIRRLLRK